MSGIQYDCKMAVFLFFRTISVLQMFFVRNSQLGLRFSSIKSIKLYQFIYLFIYLFILQDQKHNSDS
jgi:hypothetical protein